MTGAMLAVLASVWVSPAAPPCGMVLGSRNGRAGITLSTYEEYRRQREGCEGEGDETQWRVAAWRYAEAKARRAHAAAEQEHIENTLAQARAAMQNEQEAVQALCREASAAEDLSAHRRAQALQVEQQLARLDAALRHEAEIRRDAAMAEVEDAVSTARARANAEWRSAVAILDAFKVGDLDAMAEAMRRRDEVGQEVAVEATDAEADAAQERELRVLLRSMEAEQRDMAIRVWVQASRLRRDEEAQAAGTMKMKAR